MAPTDTSVRKTNLNFNIVMFAAGSIAWTQLGPTWKQHATAQVSISLDVSSCCHKGSIRKTNRLIPHHLALAFSNVQGKQERQAAVDIRETRVKSALRRLTHQCERLISTLISSCLQHDSSMPGFASWHSLTQLDTLEVNSRVSRTWTCWNMLDHVASRGPSGKWCLHAATSAASED